MKPNKKIIMVLVGAILILVIVVLVFNSKKVTNTKAAVASDKTLNSVSEQTGETPQNNVRVQEKVNSEYALQAVEALKGARVEIVGASPVNADNQVMTYDGQVADNKVEPGSALAPKPTASLTKEELPAGTVSLNVSMAGFSPKEISVKAQEPVNLSLTSTDDKVHVLMFDDASLKAVVIGVMPGETRAITFNAPSSGNYSFRCDVPGHKEQGATGVMIVK